MSMGFRPLHSSCVIRVVLHDVCCVIVFYKLLELYTWQDVYRKIMNTRVSEHNLRGSKNKMNMIVLELMCISVWHYPPLRKEGRTV